MNGYKPSRQSDEPALRQFLAHHEPEACMIIERLFNVDAPKYSWPENVNLFWHDSKIAGLLYANPHGLMLPLSVDRSAGLPPRLAPPSALVGLDRDVLPCLKQLGTCRVHWHYQTMNLAAPKSSGRQAQPWTIVPQTWQGVQFRLATANDLEALLPLQLAYELEEVLAPGMALRQDFSRLILSRHLARGLVALAQAGRQIVGKAALNATGFRYAQIGGVYTIPEWRNHGIASRLMNLLTQAMVGAGWGCTLFVKTTNNPAVAVYHKFGFQTGQPFSVIYF